MTNIELANDEVVVRLSKAASALSALSRIQKTPAEQERLAKRAEGVRKIISTQRFKLQNMRSPQDLITLVETIEQSVGKDYADSAKLARNYLMRYIS